LALATVFKNKFFGVAVWLCIIHCATAGTFSSISFVDTLPAIANLQNNQQLQIDSGNLSNHNYHPTSDSIFALRFARYQLVKAILQTDDVGLQPTKAEIKPRVVRHNQWKFFTFFFIFTLIAILRIFFNGTFSNMLRTVFNTAKTNSFIEDRTNLKPIFYLIIHIAFVFTLSLAIYSLFERFYFIAEVDDFTVFLRICLVVFLVYLIKFFVHLVMGLVFDISSTVNQYLFNVVTINSLLSIILLPILLISFYSPHSSWNVILIRSVIGIMILSIVVRYIVGIIQILRTQHFPLLYLFLYLCTFEIFPWLFIFKYIKISFLNG